jgi:hypothetical protein
MSQDAVTKALERIRRIVDEASRRAPNDRRPSAPHWSEVEPKGERDEDRDEPECGSLGT